MGGNQSKEDIIVNNAGTNITQESIQDAGYIAIIALVVVVIYNCMIKKLRKQVTTNVDLA